MPRSSAPAPRRRRISTVVRPAEWFKGFLVYRAATRAFDARDVLGLQRLETGGCFLVATTEPLGCWRSFCSGVAETPWRLFERPNPTPGFRAPDCRPSSSSDFGCRRGVGTSSSGNMKPSTFCCFAARRCCGACTFAAFAAQCQLLECETHNEP